MTGEVNPGREGRQVEFLMGLTIFQIKSIEKWAAAIV